ncbi:MAG: hypothetical protein IJY72_07795 [Akkermansia sp.]|nr:hypothetical protein [Akkermansia sp.]
MAQITGSSSEKIFQLKAFLGLHQNPDGDTKLKLGEAAAIRNFRITRDGNLQRRPGTKTIAKLADGEPVRGMWVGFVKKEEVFLAAAGGKLWQIIDGPEPDYIQLGEIDTTNDVHFFGFSEIVYMLNGKQYMQWDGDMLTEVHGYRPLVNIAVAPDNTSRETLEQINKLTGSRRVWLSPDGEGTTFTMPEVGLASIDYVQNLGDESYYEEDTDYSFDLETGSVTFKTAPEKAVNSIEVGYSMDISFRHEIEAMRYSELYSGTQDTRVFLYGDGGHEAIYSELDYYGKPRADYFPDLNEVAVGDANTPITAMIRHYSQLICYKTHSAWAISFGLTSLADSTQTAAFYVTSTNKAIGNAAPGQVAMVLNAPYTLHGNDIFEWRNTSSYTSNLSVDERQAKRISDKIYATLNGFDLEKCKCFDNNADQEYFISYNKKALVFNYAADAWYFYDNFDAACFTSQNDVLYIGGSDGNVRRVSYALENDDGNAIDAYWESGSMSFGQDYMRKYAAMLWIGIKPESRASVTVTVQTDRKSEYNEKVIASSLATFSNANFAQWSFKTSRKPFMTKLKIKAKKFVYYKLIFKSDALDTTATVTAADIRVRYTGYAK